MGEKIIALIVAAGSGSRMGGATPKQLKELQGIPLAIHAGLQFRKWKPDIQLVYVIGADAQSQWDNLLQQYFPGGGWKTAIGGNTRYESVQRGLKSLEEKDAWVAIHDGARPFIQPKMLERAMDSALQFGNAVLAVPVKDSLRQLTASGSMAVKRDEFFAVQTPQIFPLKDLKPVYQQADNVRFTDDATVMELAGYPIHLVEGSYHNIKITTAEDWYLAERIVHQLTTA